MRCQNCDLPIDYDPPDRESGVSTGGYFCECGWSKSDREIEDDKVEEQIDEIIADQRKPINDD